MGTIKIASYLTSILLTGTTVKAQSVQLQDQLFSQALEQHNTEQVINLGQTFYRSAIQHKNWLKANFYVNHIANAYCLIGTTHYKGGQYMLGITPTLLGLGWLARSRTGRDTLQFQLLSLAAACYGRIPLADSATYWYAQTSGYLSVHPQLRRTIPADVCGYYLSQANFLNLTGDFRRAFDYLQIATELARTTGNRRLLAIAYNYEGNYFFRLRQFDRAEVAYKKALQGYEAGSVDQCWGYIILGNNDRSAGKPAAGLAHLKSGQQQYKKRIAQKPTDRHIDFEIQSNYYIAECQRALNQLMAATNSYLACIDLHQQHYGVKGEFIAYSWLGLGYISQRQLEPDRAMTMARRAVATSCYRLTGDSSPADYVGTVVNEKTLYESLRLEADLWRDEWIARGTQSTLVMAVQRYDMALTSAARLRRNLMPIESKFFLSSSVASCVERAMSCSYELFRQTGQEQDKNRLFALMERHRMMISSDLLHEKYRMSTTIPPGMARQEQDLRQQTIALEKAIDSHLPEQVPDSLRQALDSVKVAAYEFLRNLELSYSRYYALKYDTKTFRISQVQQYLPEGTGYLTYYLGSDYLIGCLVSKSGCRLFLVTLPPHFSSTVNQVWQSIRNDPGMFAYTGQKPATALYDWLIRPIAGSLGSLRRLIVSRDGILHYVPFDLLQASPHATAYLGDQLSISYGYSAELTFHSSLKSRSGQARIAGFAPYSKSPRSMGVDSAYRLQWSLAEINAWGGQRFPAESATKKTFLHVAPASDIIVLATHALANETQPEQSYVAFHPVGPDSLLRATEIANLNLDTLQLLVLSACEGNAGVLQSGEGPLSLARVFRLAGCRTILTTSWKAPDESTSAFNRRFQQYIASGLPTDLALQKTRADFRTDKHFVEWQHPFHWANFTLIGTPTTLYPKATLPAEAMTIIGVLTVLGILARQLLGLPKPRQTP